ncbi:MAG: hypothetical protein P8X55_14565, partial [Desulfosarcinaceae bacterium]
MMNQTRDKVAGIAKFFTEMELKNLFLKYLQWIMLVEILLLFVMALGFAADGAKSFPTKLYLFLAFGIPLALTLILGLIIQVFEAYAFKRRISTANPPDGSPLQQNPADSFEHQPAEKVMDLGAHLLKLTLLLVAAVLVYSLEDIFGFIARMGSRTLGVLQIVSITAIGAAAVLALLWMVIHFRLKSRQLEFQYRYRKQILDQLGVLLLENDTIIDSKGNTIRIPDPGRLET